MFGHAAGGDDHHVGLLGQHRRRVGEGAEAELDTGVLGLRHPPVDDAGRSRRRDAAAASRTWPPGTSAASSTTTRALARPARGRPRDRLDRRRPPRPDDAGAQRSSRGSRSARGRWPRCGCTWRRRTGRSHRGSSSRRRTGGSCPRRPLPPWRPGEGRRSALASCQPGRASPSRSACRAVATSEIREACITGMSTARLISPANSRNGADWCPHRGDHPRQRRVALDRSLDDRQEVDAVVDVAPTMPEGPRRAPQSARDCPRPSTSGCRRRSRAPRPLGRHVPPAGGMPSGLRECLRARRGAGSSPERGTRRAGARRTAARCRRVQPPRSAAAAAT